ncbi:Gfo/Idh/MocA family protein [Loktanella sp. DJP18]|uniref:Gfo/Idh/MocA family protein n=1 Tax=Loktanella sp. DJP18 TaxID=3409788 RepID=UPI003BB66B10
MAEIGVGLIGGGYMGKAHAVALSAVGAVFNTALRPRLELICATSATSAERYRAAYGFARAIDSWRDVVADPKVGAIWIASPQATHRDIALAAFAAGKPVFCEKPLGASITDARAMVKAAADRACANMIGFNYARTPATQYARRLIADGALGRIVWFRGEHTEDFDADPATPATLRSHGRANGTVGDLSPHLVNMALALMGPIARLTADLETVHADRPGGAVTNDDQVHALVRFASGVMGHLFASRVQTGRKMGYAYEVTGTKGAIRFDQEDQNALWLYLAEGPAAQRGFRKILTGPAHPDYEPFCQGPGHGTGYQDQIIIEARDFLQAIHTGQPVWPTFADGLAVAEVTEAFFNAAETGQWVTVGDT